MNFNRSQHIYKAIYLGLVITLIQLLFACLLSGANHPVEAYTKLCYFDCGWYGKIVEHGYQSTIPPFQKGNLSNVAFFPGYPILARAFKNVFGLPNLYALLVVAQLACWGFWTYLLLFFQRWQISTKLAIGGVIAILIHPTAFFLIAGYSESLFLMTLLGFLYWSKSTRFSSLVLAALHGFVMTATRIVGLPLAFYPLFYFWILNTTNKSRNLNQQLQKSSKYLLLWGISALGTILFFVFCYLKFGYWNLYMQSQLIEWGVKPNYLAVFNPSSYLTFMQAKDLSAFISSISVPVTMVLFLICFLMEWKATKLLKEKSWRQRAEFYFCGWIIFYISASACSSLGMRSMSRYTFCVYVMLVLAIIHLISKVQPFKAIAKNWVIFLLLFLATASFLLQSQFVHKYTNSLWVA